MKKTMGKIVTIAIIMVVFIVAALKWRVQPVSNKKNNTGSTTITLSAGDAVSDATSVSEVSSEASSEVSSTSTGSTASAKSDAKKTTEFTRIYKLYNPNSGEHFYTTSLGEAKADEKAGWTYEGVAFYAPAQPTDTPVYRLSNPNTGERFYTDKLAEVNNLVQKKWTNEGIAWYSGGSLAVYRLSNPQEKSFNHTYTSSGGERKSLVSKGWKDEGICWFSLDPSTLTAKDGTSVQEYDQAHPLQ